MTTKTITAKYPATCASCKGAIAVGSKIVWAKGAPVTHASCTAITSGPRITAVAIPTRTMAPAPKARRPRTSGKWTGCSCGSRTDSYGDLIDSPRNCFSCNHDA